MTLSLALAICGFIFIIAYLINTNKQIVNLFQMFKSLTGTDDLYNFCVMFR